MSCSSGDGSCREISEGDRIKLVNYPHARGHRFNGLKGTVRGYKGFSLYVIELDNNRAGPEHYREVDRHFFEVIRDDPNAGLADEEIIFFSTAGILLLVILLLAYLKFRSPPTRKPASASKTHGMQPGKAPANTNGKQPSKTVPPPPPKPPPHSPTKILHSGSSTSVAGSTSPHSPGKAARPASPVRPPSHPSSPAGKAQAAKPASPTHPAKPAAAAHPVYARSQGFMSKSFFLQVEGESNHDTLTTESRHGKAAFTRDNVKTVKAVFHKHAKSGGGFWEIGPYTSTTTDVRITHKTDLGVSTFEASIAAAIKKGQFPKK